LQYRIVYLYGGLNNEMDQMYRPSTRDRR